MVGLNIKLNIIPKRGKFTLKDVFEKQRSYEDMIQGLAISGVRKVSIITGVEFFKECKFDRIYKKSEVFQDYISNLIKKMDSDGIKEFTLDGDIAELKKWLKTQKKQ